MIALLLFSGAVFAQSVPAPRQTVEVELTMTPAAALRQGQDVTVRFKVRDKTSGTPLENRYPSAWMDLHRDADSAGVPCKTRVQRILNAEVFNRPEIDLNTYYVVVMNRDATLTVVDPLFGYGNTKLLATTPLRSTGEDWALSADQKLLFVSMPDSGQVAVVDTATWKVVKNVDVGARAGRVALQPDGHYLWVSLESGIAALDTSKLAVAATVNTGKGPHQMVFTSDSRFAFVTNTESVSMVDTGALSARTILTDSKPAAIAFSAKSQMAYVTDGNSGVVTAFDRRGQKIATMQLEPGIGPVRFARDGRYGFILNPIRKRIHVLDSSLNRVVQSAETEHEPDQVVFSAKLAYIRQRRSEIVLMIPLDAAGVEGKAMPVADFPAGQHALDKFTLPSPADSMVRAPGEDAVLVANPADKAIYFYKEGMAAPMGFFSNYSREPRAVVVIDRTLKQTMPGVYETQTRLEKAGRYTAAFLLDSPQAVQCWDFSVEPDASLPQHLEQTFSAAIVAAPEAAKAGQPLTLRFRIENGMKKPASDVAGVRILAYRAPGVWQTRADAKALANGVYEVSLVPPQPGSYYIHVEAAALGLAVNQNRLATIHVE